MNMTERKIRKGPPFEEKPYDIPENSCVYCVHGQVNACKEKCLKCHDKSEFKRYNQSAQTK